MQADRFLQLLPPGWRSYQPKDIPRVWEDRPTTLQIIFIYRPRDAIPVASLLLDLNMVKIQEEHHPYIEDGEFRTLARASKKAGVALVVPQSAKYLSENFEQYLREEKILV